ncbi:unnamed protein product [Owenia fusiformis]|uniref:Lipocalin/cytosolic fatty-acid binding domain-containing protein n=1 Tax=Owenia fusiformis TaxID=6347 RepID=A0A8S4NME4_OWEFU|nr:unnamed protein product [Owenia fusiformis]
MLSQLVTRLRIKCAFYIGVNIAKRKIASAAPLTLVISQDGSKITIEAKSVKNRKSTFEVGAGDFDDESPDGRPVKAKAFWEGSSLVVEAKPADGKGKGLKVVRTIDGDTMQQTMTCGDVTCVRNFSKC